MEDLHRPLEARNEFQHNHYQLYQLLVSNTAHQPCIFVPEHLPYWLHQPI
jgi:hypothetical protein